MNMGWISNVLLVCENKRSRFLKNVQDKSLPFKDNGTNKFNSLRHHVTCSKETGKKNCSTFPRSSSFFFLSKGAGLPIPIYCSIAISIFINQDTVVS